MWLYSLKADSVNVRAIVILIGIPLYQLINKYCCQKYLPSMIKRMKLGLFCCLLKVVMEISLQATQETYSAQKCYNELPLIQCLLVFMQVKQNGTCTCWFSPATTLQWFVLLFFSSSSASNCAAIANSLSRISPPLRTVHSPPHQCMVMSWNVCKQD